MWSARRFRAVLAGALFLLPNAATAAIEVVGDEACEKFAADIELFATGVDGKVTRAVDEPRPAVAPARTSTAPRPAAPGPAPARGRAAPSFDDGTALARQRG